MKAGWCRSLGRLWLVALVGIGALTGGVRAADEPEFFPLMAWNWVPSDAPAFQKLRDCGLTVAGFVAPRDLDLCYAAGLRAIVHDARTAEYDWRNVDEAVARRNVASLVAEVGRHPAVYGYYLRDEPGAELFPGLAKVAALVRELAPGKWPYINLFPNYASPAQLGTATYAEHLEQFVSICQPTELSYDHYALMEDGSLRDGYWQNLEQMRGLSLRHGRPFWNIVLTVAHFRYREPTAADLRFQVFSTLAYGGRGLAYFTYFAPQVGNYRAAPVDQFGHPTATWDHLRNVNLQVGQLAPVLLRLTSTDVYHFGDVPALAHGPGPDSLVESVGEAPLVVGDFTHTDGSRYVLLVNKDLVRSWPCTPRFRKPASSPRMVSPYTGRLIGFGGEQLWLAPGQGTLLRL